MPSERNVKLREELQETLSAKNNFILSTYSGLDVVSLGEIRKELRGVGGTFKIVKNNIFHVALKESEAHKDLAADVKNHLEGPLAVVFANGDFPAVGKALVKIAKDKEQIEIKGGCFEGKFLGTAEVKEIASLPSREELLAIIGRGLNSSTQKIAMGMKEVIATLARGIKAVGEKNGDG